MTHFNSISLTRIFCMCAAITVLASPLAAHDMWIEPTTYHPQVGGIVGARLKVGQDFLGDPIAYDSALIKEFFGVDASGRRPFVGHDGSDPAGMLRVGAPGTLVLGYQSNPRPVELTAEKFNQYLREEGLEAIAEQRAARNQSSAPSKELFSRCAKSLVQAAGDVVGDGDRRLGLPLELVAEKNPYALAGSEELPVSLLYEGKPLRGALVVAINKMDPAATQSARTDANGRVKFRLASRGAWLIKAVHMTPAAAETRVDWTSYWASLTFELRVGTSR